MTMITQALARSKVVMRPPHNAGVNQASHGFIALVRIVRRGTWDGCVHVTASLPIEPCAAHVSR